MDTLVSAFAANMADVPASPVRNTLLPGWVMRDLPFAAMLLLALAGVVFRLPISYWLVLIPLFAVISIITGWHHFRGSEGHIQMVQSLVLGWAGLIVAIMILFDGAFRGTTTANTQSLVVMTLLALGTFTAGVQARVWRFCVVGGLLFLGVPAMGWLDQSPLFMMAGVLAVGATAGLVWWVGHRVSGAL